MSFPTVTWITIGHHKSGLNSANVRYTHVDQSEPTRFWWEESVRSWRNRNERCMS